MIKFQHYLLLLLILVTTGISAQDHKFGKVSKEELSETVYINDSSAVAAVLFRSKKLRYVYMQSSGFKLVTDVHERIKIYNKQGFDYATISELLYKNGGDRESISNLKAYTYSLENGSVVKNKMEKSAIFTTERSEYRNEYKFTLPNIKEGSVIEYEYKINSPFYYYMDEIVFQYDIPIKEQVIDIEAPEYFVFKPNMKGYLPVSPKFGKDSGKINYTSKNSSGNRQGRTTFNTGAIDYLINTTKYAMKNIPALKEESFVNDMDNYRSAVKYELQYVQFPQSLRENYTTSWEEVVKKIYKNDKFGGQLRMTKYYKEDLAALKESSASDSELAASIFNHVKLKMSWNSNYGYSAEKGVKQAYKENTGNIADINLMLTSMLQSAGLDASPVLVSTRKNGIPLFPTREGFNYVITAVKLEGATILLDATNKYTKPNLLPTRALNWYGRLIKKDGTFSTVNLYPKKVSRENINMSVNLTENGDIEGKSRVTYTDYDAYVFRNTNSTYTEDEYLENLENKNEGMEISDYVIKNKMTIGKPIIESYAFELDGQADVIGDKIYFSPMFFMAMDKNPFKKETRKYPIDFTYSWQERYVMNIVLPEGYEITSKPTDINMVLVDNIGGFKCQMVAKEKNLQVMVDLKMNQSVIGAEYYGDLKELFKNAVEKQTEKVVLSKITSDGTTQSSGGSR